MNRDLDCRRGISILTGSASRVELGLEAGTGVEWLWEAVLFS